MLHEAYGLGRCFSIAIFSPLTTIGLAAIAAANPSGVLNPTKAHFFGAVSGALQLQG
jgi:hypothetical protein